MSQPAIAVVISSYQAEPYIDAAVRSVLSQDFEDFEVVVQDDSSKDRTVEIARSFRDSRLRVFSQPENAGAVANFSTGISGTSADLVVKLDADDFLLPGFLRACHDELSACRDAAFVFTQAIVMGPAGCVFRTPWPASRRITGREFILDGITLSNPSNSAVMFRRAAYTAAGGFCWPDGEPPFGEDFALWLRMAAFGPVSYLAEPYVAHRWHSAGLTGRLADPLARTCLRHLGDEVERAVEIARHRHVLTSGDAARLGPALAQRWMTAADACAFLPAQRRYCLRKAWSLSPLAAVLSPHLWRTAAKLATRPRRILPCAS
jgi:glycosyltransferase involved in cell wall biosynthesis